MTHYRYLFILLLFLCLSCEKEDPLPAATGEGKNIFACYVDGSIWKHYSEDFKANTLSADYIQSDKKLSIFAYRSGNDTFEKMQIVIQNFPLQTGTYDLDGGGSYAEFIRKEPSIIGEYSTSSENRGKVIITKVDEGKRIVTGSFSFTAGQVNGSEQVKIEDGRFDVIYGLY
jgi:hypothetical protein